MCLGGQYVAKAPPMIHSRGTGPQNRLSSDSPRLSPIMNQCPAGILIVRGKSQPVPPSAQGRVKSSAWRLPLTYAWPPLMDTVSPGPATTRLMKLTSDLVDVGRLQASSGFLSGSPQVFVSAPLGGWNTTISPISGSLKRLPSRLTSTRWSICSVGSIEPLGIRYGLTRKAWMPSARPSATTTMTTSSTNELPVDLSFFARPFPALVAGSPCVAPPEAVLIYFASSASAAASASGASAAAGSSLAS